MFEHSTDQLFYCSVWHEANVSVKHGILIDPPCRPLGHRPGDVLVGDVGPEDGVVGVVKVDSNGSGDVSVTNDMLLSCGWVRLTNVFTIAYQQ